MAKITNIKSGSSAFESTSSSDRIGFFKGDVKYTFLNKKVDCTGAILPAFNDAFSNNDPAFKTSYSGYRESYSKDGIHNEFSKWIVSMRCYTYFGKGWHMILSPELMGLKDPIAMLRSHIRNHHKNDAELTRLIELPSNASIKDKLALPYQQTMGFMNAYCTPTYVAEGSNDRGEDNRVLVVTKTAANKIYEDLNQFRPASMTVPHDEKWPNYMYGDVTAPGRAVRFHTSTCKITNGEACCLSFGKIGRTGVPTIEEFNITNDMLAGRVELDDDDVLYIPEYNQLVDLLIEEGDVPFDLIDQVCSDFYDGAFPRKKSAAKVYTPEPVVKEAKPVQNQYAPSSVLADDPDDDIPMDDAPASSAPSAPAAAPTSSALTPEELEEYNNLRARFTDTSLPAPDMALIDRYRTLSVKLASANK